MPDHRIRLRGGWEYRLVDASTRAERITLPTFWTADQSQRVRLTRRFGRPPVDPHQEHILLSLEQVPGIYSIRLNDREIPQVSPDRSSYDVPLDDLPDRMVLVLDVDPHLAQKLSDATTSEWGCVALVVRNRLEWENPPETR